MSPDDLLILEMHVDPLCMLELGSFILLQIWIDLA